MVRRLVVSLALLVAMAIGVGAQSNSAVEQEVRAADKSWADNYQKCDIPGYEKILADDYYIIHNSGRIDDRASFIQSVKPCGVTLMQSVPDKIGIYNNGTAAVVRGNQKYQAKGMAAPGTLIYTRVWVKQGGQWKLVSHQSTDPPKPK